MLTKISPRGAMVKEREVDRLVLNDERLFADDLPESGELESHLADGTTIRATVVDSQIAGYTASDSDGNRLQVRRIRLTDVSAGDSQPGIRAISCFYCICNSAGCRCWPEPCPIA